MPKRMNFPHRKQARRDAAVERQARWDSMGNKKKLSTIRERMGIAKDEPFVCREISKLK